MLNKEELKSFQEKSVIDSWYNTRAEDLYVLNNVDRKKIAEIRKGEDSYQKIANEISKIAKEDDMERILEKIDKYCNKLINIGGYENEKLKALPLSVLGVYVGHLFLHYIKNKISL